MKKILSWMLALIMLTSMCAFAPLSVSAETYSPVTAVKWNGHIYCLYDESMTWEEAKVSCENLGGHLATFTSEEEWKAVHIKIKENRKNYWLGGFGEENKNTWKWITNEEWAYADWCLGEPNNGYGGKENYLGTWTNTYQWNDYRLDTELGFICEWDGDKDGGFTGFRTSDWAKAEVEEAYNEDLITEMLKGEDLTQKINRAEFAAIAVSLYENLSGKKAEAGVNPFKDISGNAYETEILKAYNLGITIGSTADTFAPDKNIPREQIAMMLTRAYKKAKYNDWSIINDSQYPLDISGVIKFDDDREISDYAKESVYFMARYGIINGVGSNKFAPKNNLASDENYGYATREQAVIMALRSSKTLK